MIGERMLEGPVGVGTGVSRLDGAWYMRLPQGSQGHLQRCGQRCKDEHIAQERHGWQRGRGQRQETGDTGKCAIKFAFIYAAK